MDQTKFGSGIISAIVIVGFFTVVVVLMLRPFAIDGNVAQILNILLGALSANFGSVVQYHIGSSSGSKAKDAIIASQIAPVAPPGQRPRTPLSGNPNA